MANKDLFKQAIAEAKSVREAAIANAKEALEETLTPHLKDMLAAKLQEMEDSTNEEEVVNEVEEEVEEAVEESTSGFTSVEEAEDEDAEDDSEESEDEAPEEEDEAEHDAGEDHAEVEAEEEIDGDEDLSKLSVDQFKGMIRDIIAQEVGGIAAADDMDAGDIEGMGDEAPLEEPGMEAEPEMGAEDELGGDEEEIDLDELIRELEATTEEVAEGSDKEDETMEEEVVEEETSVQVPGDAESKEDKAKNINRTLKEDLQEALDTIEHLNKDLLETNLLNSKLLYVNKIFKSNDLSEAQKVNIIAAFDKAETVKEVKLVFETVSDNVVTTKKGNVTESKLKGMASKATGITASKPEVISEVSDAVRRMQKLAGIIK
tara:strand:- start:1475 stop:2599 length:1125 start_codon:yes stop_codon:yes gene_type:complete